MSSAPEQPTETVRKIAELARLDLSGDEAAKLAREFASILEQFKVLEGLDVSGVEAMVGASRAGEILREDVAVPSFPVDAMLRNAPEHTPEFYVVPKTVGGEPLAELE